MAKANTDIAYEILKETTGGLPFATIWDQVAKEKDYELEEKNALISNFYTDIMLDGRFITLGENVWDLRENNAFDKVHIDMNDIYSSDEDEVIEVEEGIIAKEDIDENIFGADDDEEETKDEEEVEVDTAQGIQGEM